MAQKMSSSLIVNGRERWGCVQSHTQDRRQQSERDRSGEGNGKVNDGGNTQWGKCKGEGIRSETSQEEHGIFFFGYREEVFKGWE